MQCMISGWRERMASTMSFHDSGGTPSGRDVRGRSNSWAMDVNGEVSDGGGSVEGEGAGDGEAEEDLLGSIFWREGKWRDFYLNFYI